MAATADRDPEEPIIEAIRQGDRQAFHGFLRRHDRWVRGIVFAVLGDAQRIDDVAQQAWTSVWERARELREIQRWRPWLYRVVRNAALDAGREEQRARRLTERLAERTADPSAANSPLRAMVDDEARGHMLAAIEALPPHYREPFVLRHIEDWNYRQIAELLGCPVDTVETRLVRARRLLRDALRGKV